MYYPKRWRAASIMALFIIGSNFTNCLANTASQLPLNEAIQQAKENDPWLVGSRHYQDSIESMSIAAGSMPDPKMSLGLANIASDTFDFAQEGMTQFKVGISQNFPRGDTLELRRKQLKITGNQYPLLREDRRAKISVETAKLWFDIYKAQESIALIETDRSLFEQLADVAQASYSSTIGKTRQQDIVRAQLELTRLDDRLSILRQNKEMTGQKLNELLNNYHGEEVSNDNEKFKYGSDISLPSELPNIRLLYESLSGSSQKVDIQKLFQFLAKHPIVKAMDQKIQANSSNIDLAKQKFKPEWGVSASYGVRDNTPNGVARSDLFSVAISFDIPLFTGSKQDKELQSAISNHAAVKTEKWLLIRKLQAQFETNRAHLNRLNDRQELFRTQLLPQMHDQSEASLTAYTNDDGDFAEVVRSRIAELNALIDALSIDVERQKIIVQLNYFFVENSEQLISNTSSRKLESMSDGEYK